MTHQVLKSALAPYPAPYDEAVASFGRIVDAYVRELQVWHDHHIKAHARCDEPERARPEWHDFAKSENPEKDFTNAMSSWTEWSMTKHDPYPKPDARADVVESVATKIGDEGDISYTADFEVVNDDPTPEQVLAAKKLALLGQVSQLEAAAIEATQIASGKRRLANLREGQISEKDRKIGETIWRDTPEEKRASLDLAAEIEKRRDPDDTNHLNDQAARREAVGDISTKAAQVMSDIEDLTVDTVDQFQLPSFD